MALTKSTAVDAAVRAILSGRVSGHAFEQTNKPGRDNDLCDVTFNNVKNEYLSCKVQYR